MKQINNDILLEILIFIEGKGGLVSRYVFEQYIITTFHIENSIQIIPKSLVEMRFIEILHSNNTVNIQLTKLGSDRIKEIFEIIIIFFKKIQNQIESSKFKMTVFEYIPKLRLSYREFNFLIRVFVLEDNLFVRIQNTKNFGEITLSETEILLEDFDSSTWLNNLREIISD